jgi:hypothetical protein
MMIIIILMRHECIWGTVWGYQQEWGGVKKKILRDDENGTMLHIYIWGQHNETHQTLSEKGGEGKGRMEI